MFLGTVSVKVDEGLRRKMWSVKVNWSEYIRDAIRCRVELEARKGAAQKLLLGLKKGKRVAPSGFVDEALKDVRDGR